MFELAADSSGFSAQALEINNIFSSLLNSLAGQSLIFDNLVGLVLKNNLVKAGIIGACFFAAWHEKKTILETVSARKILLATLFAIVAVLATMRVISHSVLIPRTFVQTQKIYFLEENRLVENVPVQYRLPLDETSRKDFRDLRHGDVDVNNLGSFPSDHAGFFLALSLGICFASRRFGIVALVWTLCIIYPSKLISGQHTLLDIAAGAMVGAVLLLACQFLANGRADKYLNYLSEWTIKNRVWSSALLFVVVFELTSTLTHVREFLRFAATAGKFFLTS
jgi:membrane-associated phospholipid phosphatase